MSILRYPLNTVMSNCLKGTLASLPYAESDVVAYLNGAFTSAFSSAFDLYESETRVKEFTSAFSDAFTNDNI